MALSQTQINQLNALSTKATLTPTDQANLTSAKAQGYVAPTTQSIPQVIPNPEAIPNYNVTGKSADGKTLMGVPKTTNVSVNKNLLNEPIPSSALSTSAPKISDIPKIYRVGADIYDANTQQKLGPTQFAKDYARAIEVSAPASAQVPVPTPAVPVEQPKPMSASDKISEFYNNFTANQTTAKNDAIASTGLNQKSDLLTQSTQAVNDARTKLQDTQVIDQQALLALEGQGRGLTTGIVRGLQGKLNQQQQLEFSLLQNDYNNKLVASQIAQGAYDRAASIVKDTADDFYKNATMQLDALKFQGQIEDKAYDRLQTELTYERDLAKEGYVYISDPAELAKHKADELYRDPSNGKIYLKPKPTIKQVITANGKLLGVDENGNVLKDFGQADQQKPIEIGTDTDGNKLFGIFDPATNTMIPLQNQGGSTAPGATDLTKGIVAGYDIKSYATDPKHEQRVNDIYNNLSVKGNDFNAIQTTLNQYKAPFTAEQVLQSAQKYGVDPVMIMAMIQQDSSYGTAGKGARTFNPGNVGNNDSGQIVNFGNWQSGLDAVAKNLAGRKVGGSDTSTTNNVDYKQYGLIANTSFNPKIETDKNAVNYLDSYLKSTNGSLPTATSLFGSSRGNNAAKFVAAQDRAKQLYFEATGSSLPDLANVNNNKKLIATNNKVLNNQAILGDTIIKNFDLAIKGEIKNNVNKNATIVNRILNPIYLALGDPATNQALVSNGTISQEFANLISIRNGQGTTVADKVMAEELIKFGTSVDAQKAVVERLKQEAANIHTALQDQNSNLWAIVDPLQQNPENPNRKKQTSGGVDYSQFYIKQ